MMPLCKQISYNLGLGVSSDMALVFVFVVSGVTVVDAARVVTHTGDGHPVGVAEHRGHGQWSLGHHHLMSEYPQVLVEDVNGPGSLCSLSATVHWSVLMSLPSHIPASSILRSLPSHRSKHQL